MECICYPCKWIAQLAYDIALGGSNLDEETQIIPVSNTTQARVQGKMERIFLSDIQMKPYFVIDAPGFSVKRSIEGNNYI